MDKTIKLYRRRYIPEELAALKNDSILEVTDNTIITRWKTLRPRMDFAGGISAFFLSEGWKISKILDAEGKLVHWYCDIIDVIHNEAENSLIYEDLLFDVVVYPNGKYKILDCDEAAEAFEKGLITGEQMQSALRSLHELLEVIYHDRFDRLQSIIDSYDH